MVKDLERQREELADLKTRLELEDRRKTELATLIELEDIDFESEVAALTEVYGDEAVQRELERVRYASPNGFERAAQSYDELKDSLVSRLDPNLDDKLVAGHVALGNLNLPQDTTISSNEWSYRGRSLYTVVHFATHNVWNGDLFVTCAENDLQFSGKRLGRRYFTLIVTNRERSKIGKKDKLHFVGEGFQIELPEIDAGNNPLRTLGAYFRRCPSLLNYQLSATSSATGGEWVKSVNKLRPHVKEAVDRGYGELVRELIDEMNAIPQRIGQYLERRNREMSGLVRA